MELRSRVAPSGVGVLLLQLLLSGVVAVASATRSTLVPAIFVFGDSTADVGNNNQGEGFPMANFPPNGIDYPGGKPTGRFCNGYLAVDFLAMKLGFKESPPAYFSQGLRRRRFRGVNFASAGSGILDTTRPNISFTLNTQIRFFEDTTRKLALTMGRDAMSTMLSKSIFILSTASNDIFEYFITTASSNQSTSTGATEQFISSLSDQYKNQIMRIYDLGARKFVVFGTGLLGCPPALKLLNPSGECVEELNQLSKLFNQAMRWKLHHLCSTTPGMKYSYINSIKINENMATYAPLYGFTELDEACCGDGRLNAETLCLPNSSFCSNRMEYLSWDFVHPTEAANEVNARLAYGGSMLFAHPRNVYNLVKDA